MSVRAIDVAAYILDRLGPVTAMKLQKLVYYSQAWSLVWDDRLLFPDRIEAWAMGPVVPELYAYHRGQFEVGNIVGGNSSALDDDQRDTVNSVLGYYGNKSSQWLSDLTHMEAPWLNARNGLGPSDYCTNEIAPADMAEYYSSIGAPR